VSTDAGEPDELDELFGRDYLDFYTAKLSDATNDHEAQTIADILQLTPGLRVLDLPCGYGRIARRLAAMGAEVTGVDRSELLLAHAKQEAETHDAAVDYHTGDMRSISFDAKFDVVLSWFTSFGYADDETLRAQLALMHRALAPNGRLVIETLNLHQLDLQASESSETSELRDDDGTHLMIDRTLYDPHDGRLHVRRFVARSGQPTRMTRYDLRLFTLPELADWLRAAGFTHCQAYGADCEAFCVDSDRLIVVAQRA